jgi:hypothetical protein
MPEYRFYKIKKSGHIDGPPVEHDFSNDSAALTEARKLLGGQDVEVWQGRRVVAYLVPDPAGTAPIDGTAR